MNEEDKVRPTLTEEELRGQGAIGSKREADTIEMFEAAKDALARVDVDKLFLLYEKAVRQHNKMEDLYLTVAHYSFTHKDGELPLPPRLEESESVVGSMEKVALAAIELAKIVALDGKE